MKKGIPLGRPFDNQQQKKQDLGKYEVVQGKTFHLKFYAKG